MRRLLVTVCSLLPLSACAETNGDRMVIMSNAADVTVATEQITTFPMTASTFQIQIIEGQFAQLEPSSIQATLTITTERKDIPANVTHLPDLPLRLSLDSGASIQLGSTDVDVIIENDEFAEIEFDLLVDVVGRRIDNQQLEVASFEADFTVFNTTPPPFNTDSPPRQVIEAILGTEIPDFPSFGTFVPTNVPVLGVSATQDPRVPSLGSTEMFQIGTFTAELSQQQLDDAFLGMTPTFPIGTGDFGETVQSATGAPMMPGRYLFGWYCTVEDVVLSPTTCFPGAFLCFSRYQFCIDADNDAANNFMPSIPLDQEQPIDTDTVYRVEGFNGGAASLSRQSIAMAGGGFTQEPTAARVITFGPAQIFVIPVDEISTTETQVSGRFATLIHDSGFGLGPAASFDTEPQIDQPLLPISLQAGQ